nr:MAG TPA_asm: hypothetical protein [Caudoviricetes sp.]
MQERVRVVRVEQVRDPDTFIETQRWVEVWSGPCRVQTYEPDTVEVNAGGRFIARQEDRLHVPIDAGPFETGDVAFVGEMRRPYRIEGDLSKTYKTAQRLQVTRIVNSEVVGDGSPLGPDQP